MSRELYLLSSFQVPTKHRLMLDGDDVAAFLNGYLALWHPALVAEAPRPPQVASPYDHEQPHPGAVYAVPDNPPTFLPEDWRFRLKEAGAVSFQVTPDRAETEAKLREVTAIGESAGGFSALGLGCLVLNALAEAMDHANPLPEEAFWGEVQRAAKAMDSSERQEALQAAATKLQEAREILYSSHLYQLDLACWEPGQPLPVGIEVGSVVNLLSTGKGLQTLATTAPAQVEQVKQAVQAATAEVVVGPWEEETETLWPLERQIASLTRSITEYRRVLESGPLTYGRQRFAATAHLPALLHACGLRQLLLLPWDTSVLPSFKGATVEWAAQGKSVAALVRKPEPSHEAATYFHLAHLLHESILQDFTACLILGTTDKPAAPWHRDWLELHRLAPVFGQLVTLSQFLTEVSASDYPPALPADDFQSDYLVDLHEQQHPQPVSRFAQAMRQERETETAQVLAGLTRSLTSPGTTEGTPAERLTQLVMAGSTAANPGYLLFNACNFPRCLPVELSGVTTPLPAPARATQLNGDQARAVVEVPPLGYAWVPRAVPAGTKVSMPKLKMLDGLTLRNEYLEAEIDPQTGGLRVVRDALRKISRLGQQLVYQPGSSMRGTEAKVTSAGPALGEITTTGELVDNQQEVLATFRQRFRLWWARPILEIQIELHPTRQPQGYPWHAYFGSRFAWRDPHASLKRSVGWGTHATALTRPETPDFLEIHIAGHRTAILTGGLPFHQRHGPRMADVVLLPEHETGRVFELALALDVEEPLCTAYDWLTPPVVIPTPHGPPAAGPSGWFCWVDSSNLLVTRLQPVAGADALTLRVCECRGVVTEAAVRFVRDPKRAMTVDEFDEPQQELEIQGDAVLVNLGALDMLRLRVEFGAMTPNPGGI